MRCLLLLGTIGLLLVPRPVMATCEDEPCDVTDRWRSFDLFNTAVAPDGVLVFNAYRGPLSQMTDSEALEHVSAEVTADGQPITGSFEIDGWGGVIWRPDAAFPAGASLSVTLSVDNDAIGPGSCGSELELGPHVIQVTSEPAPALELASVEATASSSHQIYEYRLLDTLVCCDGAYPDYHDLDCTLTADWKEGYCASTRAHGRLSTLWRVSFAALAPELAGNLAWRVSTPEGTHHALPAENALQVVNSEPICGRIELLQRATGEVFELEQQCFGDDVAARLGDFDLDPTEQLAAMCTGQPYVCELDQSAKSWDAEACEPVEKGCSCVTSGASPLAGLSLLVLLGLIRRRRAD